jgi:hypothetical protein
MIEDLCYGNAARMLDLPVRTPPVRSAHD